MKGSHSVKATKNNMLRCLPLGKNLFCYHQGRNGVLKHQSLLFSLWWEGILISMDVYRYSTSINLIYTKIPIKLRICRVEDLPILNIK